MSSSDATQAGLAMAAKHCESPVQEPLGAFVTHRRITGQMQAWEEAIFGGGA